MPVSITLPDETKAELISALQHYFREERDEEIGGLQAGFLLDFVLREIGPSIYNQAVRDAQQALQRTVADLDATLHVAETDYGASRSTRRGR